MPDADVIPRLVFAVVGAGLGYGVFELQEWRRRRLHAATLAAALRSELERSERVLASFVALEDAEIGSMPATAALGQMIQHSVEAGLWAEDDPRVVRTKEMSEEQAKAAIDAMAKMGYTDVPSLTTPILDAVLTVPPQGWDAELLRQLSGLAWQTHLLNSAQADMQYWLRATITVADQQHADAVENYTGSLNGFKRHARVVLRLVRRALPLTAPQPAWRTRLRRLRGGAPPGAT